MSRRSRRGARGPRSPRGPSASNRVPPLAPVAGVPPMGAGGARLAFPTDSFVVKPIRFPGGSIGELAVNGTVNDLAVSGARPLALSLSLILEAGPLADDLRAEVEAVAAAARAAGLEVVA